jgi:hypothetical protein
MNEWQIIEGFSKRGMMFARKFSSKKTPLLLDAIDRFIHENSSTIAGKPIASSEGYASHDSSIIL